MSVWGRVAIGREPAQARSRTGIARRLPIVVTILIGAYLLVALLVLQLPVAMAIVLLLGAAAGVTILVRPGWGFLALVGTFSAETLLGYSPMLTATKLLGGAVVGSWVLSGLLRREYRLPSDPLLLLPLAYLATAAISLVVAENLVTGIAKLSTIFQLNLLVLLAATLLRRREDLRRLSWILLGSTLLSAIYGLQQVGLQRQEALEGLTTNRNAVGLFISMCIPLVFYFYTRVSALGKVVLLLSTGICLLAEGLSYSRGGFVVFLIALAASMLFAFRGARVRAVIPLAGLALAVAVFLPGSYWDRVRTILPAIQQGGETMGIRYHLWDVALRMFWDHPLLGVGPGNYMQQFMRYGGIIGLRRSPLVSHNAILAVAAELGALGVASFVLLFGATAVRFFRVMQAAWKVGDRDLHDLAACYGIILTIFLVGGLDGNVEYYKYLWMLVGIAAFLGSLPPEPASAGGHELPLPSSQAQV